MKLLQHGALSCALLRRHAGRWKLIHSVTHAITALCVFCTVLTSVLKEDLPSSQERAIETLATLTALLPFVASVLMMASATVAPRRKWATLQLGAHSCEAELWTFRASAGAYHNAATREACLVEALQAVWDDLRPARALGPPLRALEHATLGAPSRLDRASDLLGVRPDVSERLGSGWMKQLLALSSYHPAPAVPAETPAVAGGQPRKASAVVADDLVVADLVAASLADAADAVPVAPDPASCALACACACACAPSADFEQARDATPTRRTVEQIELEGQVHNSASRSPRGGHGASAAHQTRRRRRSSNSWRAAAFSPLTAQRYQELRVWPTLGRLLVVAPRRLRQLRTLQRAILTCTLAASALAALSLSGQHGALAPGSAASVVAARAARYIPVVLAAAAALASFIEAEQLALRARGADATAQALERAGRWYEGLPTRERSGASVRAMLVQQVEQAMRDEISAHVEMTADRRAVLAKRSRTLAARGR